MAYGTSLPSRIPANSPTTDIYISPTGSDATGTGTFANPWKSLQKAFDNVALTGGRIFARGGTYSLASLGDQVWSRNGDSSNPPILLPYLDEAPTFNVSQLRFEGSYFRFKGQNTGARQHITLNANTMTPPVISTIRFTSTCHHIEIDRIFSNITAPNSGSVILFEGNDNQVWNSRFSTDNNAKHITDYIFSFKGARNVAANCSSFVVESGATVAFGPGAIDCIATAITTKTFSDFYNIKFWSDATGAPENCIAVGIISAIGLAQSGSESIESQLDSQKAYGVLWDTTVGSGNIVADSISWDNTYGHQPTAIYPGVEFINILEDEDPRFTRNYHDYEASYTSYYEREIRIVDPRSAAKNLVTPTYEVYLPAVDKDGLSRISADAGCYRIGTAADRLPEHTRGQVDTRVSKFYSLTSPGTQTIDTGLGATPTALIFIYSILDSTEDTIKSDSKHLGFGMCAATLDQGAIGMGWPTNYTQETNGSGYSTNTGSIIQVGQLDGGGIDYDETILAHAEVTALNSDGTFDLNWTTAYGTSFPVAVWAASGMDNCVLGSFTANSTGEQPIELGFTPTCVAVMVEVSSEAQSDTQINFQASFNGILANSIWPIEQGGPTDPYYKHATMNINDWNVNPTIWGAGMKSTAGTYKGSFNTLTGDLMTIHYEAWNVALRTDGFDVVKLSGGNGLYGNPPVYYLAFDSIYMEPAWDSPAYYGSAPVVPVDERQWFPRLAVNSAIVPTGYEWDSCGGLGFADRFGNQYAAQAVLVGYNSAGPHLCETGHAFYNDVTAASFYPQRASSVGGMGATLFATREFNINWEDPDDFNISICGSRDVGHVSGVDLFPHWSKVAVFGEIAKPGVITEEPDLHMSGSTLYLTFNASMNPNLQINTRVWWEYGLVSVFQETGRYENSTPTLALSYGSQSYATSYESFRPIWGGAAVQIGQPVSAMPYPPFDTTTSYFTKYNHKWQVGRYYCRAVVSNRNGIVYGDPVIFVIPGEAIDLTKIRFRTHITGDA